MNWFLPLQLFFSLSFRSPNTLPNPTDYEIAVGMEKKDQLYISRQWERESGQYFVDEEYWTQWQSQSKRWIAKDRYLRNTAQDIVYNQSDIRLSRNGFSGGYALRYSGGEYQHNAIAGYSIDKRFNFIVINAQLTVNLELVSDLSGLDYSIYAKQKLGLLQNVDLFGLLRTERFNTKNSFQAKIGVEIELPTMRG